MHCVGKVPNRAFMARVWIRTKKKINRIALEKGFSHLWAPKMDFHYLCMSLILDLMTWYSFMCTWLIWQPLRLFKDLKRWESENGRCYCYCFFFWSQSPRMWMKMSRKKINKTIKVINEMKKRQKIVIWHAPTIQFFFFQT